MNLIIIAYYVFMAYPYFIEDTLTLCAIGVAGTSALIWARN